MQQDQTFESEEDEKVTATSFPQSKPIDLGSDYVDERRIATLGIATDGPFYLGSNSSDEAKISIDIVPNMQRAPNVVALQELKDTNQNLQAENAKEAPTGSKGGETKVSMLVSS